MRLHPKCIFQGLYRRFSTGASVESKSGYLRTQAGFIRTLVNCLNCTAPVRDKSTLLVQKKKAQPPGQDNRLPKFYCMIDEIGCVAGSGTERSLIS